MKRALLFISLLFPVGVSAESPAFTQFQNGLVIGTIHFDRQDVFPPRTQVHNQPPYSWANTLHIITKERYIQGEILFQPGDPFDYDQILESERILRESLLFRQVTVTPLAPVNGKVDILIETEDVWTTSVRMALGRAGGETTYRIGFLERNFLGYGVQLGAFVRQDIDRLVRGVNYKDPNFLHTGLELFTGYGKDEKGREFLGQIQKPFHSVLNRGAGGLSYRLKDDEDRLFENGDEVANFQHESEDLRSYLAWAHTTSPQSTRRVRFSHLYEDDVFFDFNSSRPTDFPEDRTVSGLLLGYEFKNLDFVKDRAVLTLDRDEDINLGLEMSLDAGPSLEAIGASQDGGLIEATIQKNMLLGRSQFLFLNGMVETRIEKEQIQNGILDVAAHYVAKHWWREHTFTANTKWKWGKNLDEENQFLLGGDRGLRGYSVRQFSGSKSALLTFENRQVLLYDWLHLVTLGWATFLDTGYVWKEGENLDFGDLHSDAGFGIRFSPTRAVDSSLIRIDLAYALNDNDRSSRWVLFLGAEVLFGVEPPNKFMDN